MSLHTGTLVINLGTDLFNSHRDGTLTLPAHPSHPAKGHTRKRVPAHPAWESWWSGLSRDLTDMRPGNISVHSA